MKLCCKMLGTAMAASCRSTRPEKQRTLPCTGIFASRRSTTATASTQLTPWHRKVAQATPATPIRNTVTNRMSTAILAVEEAAKNRKGVRESPRAEKIPLEML